MKKITLSLIFALALMGAKAQVVITEEVVADSVADEEIIEVVVDDDDIDWNFSVGPQRAFQLAINPVMEVACSGAGPDAWFNYEGDFQSWYRNSKFGAGSRWNFGLDLIGKIRIGSNSQFCLGLGYRVNLYTLNNNIALDSAGQFLTGYTPETYHSDVNRLVYHAIELPIGFHFSGLYIGVRPGMNLCGVIHQRHYTGADTDLSQEKTSPDLTIGTTINRFSCKIVLGSGTINSSKKFISNDFGTQFYINVLPTIVNTPEGCRKVIEYGTAISF